MLFALTPALLLAGAASAAPRSEIYRAIGTEPGWTLTIERETIRYVGDYGKTRVTTKTPVARPSLNGRRYVTRRITVDITRGDVQRRDERPRVSRASHRHDRAAHRARMRRHADGNRGATRRLALEHHPDRWTPGTNRADDRGALHRRPVSGNAGCNGFGGTYRIVGGQI